MHNTIVVDDLTSVIFGDEHSGWVCLGRVEFYSFFSCYRLRNSALSAMEGVRTYGIFLLFRFLNHYIFISVIYSLNFNFILAFLLRFSLLLKLFLCLGLLLLCLYLLHFLIFLDLNFVNHLLNESKELSKKGSYLDFSRKRMR